MSERRSAELSVEEVAELLGITSSKVYGRANAGLIPHHRVGRHFVFWRSEIEQWLSEGRPSPKAATTSSSDLLDLLRSGLTFEVTIKLKGPTR